MISKHLSLRQLRGLKKIGDIIAPGDQDFPSFSASGNLKNIDRILAYMPESDLKDLKLLLTIFSFLPMFCLAGLMRFLEYSPHIPNILGGALFRMIRLGLRGLVFSLYYSEGQPLHVLSYDVGVYKEDLPI